MASSSRSSAATRAVSLSDPVMKSSRLLGSLAIVCCLATAPHAASTDTRLVDAAKSGNLAAVTGLLRQRAPVNATEADGSSALHWAARLDQVDMVRTLLRSKAQVNVANRYGVTPLALAAVNGSAP